LLLKGITYNNGTLYWTSGKKIMTKDISNKFTKEHELVTISSSKSLFYLKYFNDHIYVSSVKIIYKCSISNSNCEIFIDNLGSARGLFIHDSLLFIADYKNREIIRKSLKNSSQNASVVLSELLSPNLGNVFQLAFYEQTLIWSEFSGTVKYLNGSNESSILFKTFDEFVYSVTLMSIELSKKDLHFRDIYDDYEDYVEQIRDNKEETTSLYSYLLSILKTTDNLITQKMTSTQSTLSIRPTYTWPLSNKTKLTTLQANSIATSTQTNASIVNFKLFEKNSTSLIQINFKKANELETNETAINSHMNRSLTKSTSSQKYFYLVSFLLCFSVFINILLLYINSMKRQKGELVIQNPSLNLIETNSHRNNCN
jgi:hypothetical protein